jgi:hypothetical protein
MLTLGEHWVDHYLAGVVLLHILLGQDPPGAPKSPPTPAVLVQLLQDVTSGKYDPAKYFGKGPLPPLAVAQEPPVVDAQGTYEVVTLNAVTARNTKVSVTSGGVLFEEPVWAILAAYAVSPYHHGLRVALPMAPNTAALWVNIEKISGAIRTGEYKPEHFFGPIDGFIPPAGQPSFELASVPGAKLLELRARGFQTMPIAGRPKYFELFLP